MRQPPRTTGQSQTLEGTARSEILVRPSQRRVRILGQAPAGERGLAEALNAVGLDVEEPLVDVAERTPQRSDVTSPGEILLVTMRTFEDQGSIRQSVSASEDALVIALIAEDSSRAYRSALRAGAKAAVPDDASVAEIVAVVIAATRGYALLPTPVALDLAAAPDPEQEWLSDEEAEWLRLLGQGLTVATLARNVGRSERAMYRLLHGLYGRMNVSNRSEALTEAAKRGYL